MTRSVVVYISPGHDLVHTSLLHTGFCALADRGAITLRYERPAGADAWLAGDPIVVCFDIAGASPLRVAVDLRDGEGTSWPIIDRVDRYLKRAHYRPEVDRLPPQHAVKMSAFGLNFGCRNGASTWRLLTAIGLPLAMTGKTGLSRLRQYLLTPPISAFEQDPSVPVSSRVTFQTRLWTQDEVAPGEAAPLNEDRVTMVRALRQAFGDRFAGGLVPTPFARAHYPGDVTPHSSQYSDYLKLRKQCLVGVYTRGVEHSLAFKLGETFAASQCLVSVPLRYEVPSPIEAETHYLPFDTPGACVDACRRLLDNSGLASDMRHANHEYYEREVEPAAHVSRMLDRLADRT
jgi:hypothetical protein